MIPSTLFSVIGLATAVIAAPPHRRTLAADDVILLGHDGTSRIIKASAYDALETATPLPEQITSYNTTSTPGLLRRGCEQSTEVQVTSDEQFLNWDVAISPVASSSAGSSAIISISDGVKIKNTLKIGSQISFGGPKIISVSLNMNLDMSWSTSQENSLQFGVPANRYGVIVSQPSVRRVQGNVLTGCTDSPTRAPFVADTYESQGYGQLSWVKGVIRLCTSETYPIPFCIGEGEHR
ncbi:hypothetical protein CORC01_14128 [Colletotrichum orchidophilum]|uniref:Celp0028 effector like protein n=1 Tax=Colletotrichum orchidophilum TaxID=1209926 RepID=A0A1G4AN86_9PEZI|nr:uncharacterized protein CORC01_14128 [Colletotrichum orchidophilum]OHE90581.1 hypothetical protein CORC01_14128 [Colletotrichum orchidophilum]